jgi:prolyl oligopeptidase
MLLLLLSCARPLDTLPAEAEAAWPYPESPRGATVDRYFGESVADPYRWLEDPDSPETRAWVEAQNALTRQVIDAVPQRAEIHQRLTQLWDFEKLGTPSKRAGLYLWDYNDGLSNQALLMVGEAPFADGARVLLDPNTLSEDGTVALNGTSVSWDGRWLAYAVSDGGSDWQTWRVRDIETGEDTGDLIEWSKFSGAAWDPDGEGFYYARYPAPEDPLEEVNLDQALYYHALGTPQSSDRLVYSNPDEPEWGYEMRVTEDGLYLIIEIGQGTEEKTRVYVQPLLAPEGGGEEGGEEGGDRPALQRLFDDFDAYYLFVGSVDDRLWFRTNSGAPLGRVISVSLEAPGEWTEVIPEREHALQGVSFTGGHLAASYLEDARSAVQIYTPEGEHVRDVELPGVGTVWGFEGRQDEAETFFSFSSFTTPGEIWRYDIETGAAERLAASQVDFDGAAYETHQVFYESADGTRVPMFITHRAGLDPAAGGCQPTLLYGYGGFNIPITPSFRVSTAAWLERGGVYAVANLRGGGEYGEAWHEAGTKLHKQNVFDDFIAAAEHLIDQGYTCPERLAIEGRSNGGLLVGATMLQRPDLFGAALPGVGVLDMLRYHRFTIGWAWASDYGTSEESEEMFRYLRAYSPVHNAVRADYPATLITTGDHDDRVVPAHSYKFAAALQEAQVGPEPVLIRVETRAGHGSGKPTAMQIDELADKLAFLEYALSEE